MAQTSILTRYLSPAVLARMADQRIEAKLLVEGNLAGAHKSPRHGFAVEFAGHREYVPGDDPKHIDWRVYFTREKYFIKQYEMETNFVCHLVLDVSASMRYGEGSEQKMQYAAEMAATLGYSVVHQSDKVSLTTFDQGVVDHVPPSNAMGQVIRMTHVLDQIEPVKKTDLGASLQVLCGRFKRREIVMIFSDFFSDLTSLEGPLQQLRWNKHEVVLFHTLHHDEIAFDLAGMVKFVGLESDQNLLAQPDDLRKSYLDAMAAHTAQLEDICNRNQIEYVPVDTSRDMGEVLCDYLHRRSLLNRGR
ncbi:MAG: DUF58 domain-containing protein [Planctomycetaceae bacterium]|nr:DUF58 domain-containing protein [Planctomycetaceae bacterium]